MKKKKLNEKNNKNSDNLKKYKALNSILNEIEEGQANFSTIEDFYKKIIPDAKVRKEMLKGVIY